MFRWSWVKQGRLQTSVKLRCVVAVSINGKRSQGGSDKIDDRDVGVDDTDDNDNCDDHGDDDKSDNDDVLGFRFWSLNSERTQILASSRP